MEKEQLRWATHQLCWEPNCPLKWAGKIPDSLLNCWKWSWKSTPWMGREVMGLTDPAESTELQKFSCSCTGGRAGRETRSWELWFPGRVEMEYGNKSIFQDMQPQSARPGNYITSALPLLAPGDVLEENVLRNISGMEPFGGIPSLQFLTLAFAVCLELWVLLSTQFLATTAAKLSSVEL